MYRDRSRYTYRTLRQRIGQLASGLAGLGLRPGDTVAVMDWDSHRYLECFFAIPMMGAVLQTVNIRLSPQQIIYTLNHAGADFILCHTDFLPILDSLKDRLETVKTCVVLRDESGVAELLLVSLCVCGRVRRVYWPRVRSTSIFPILTRTPAQRPSIQPARPAIRKASIIAIDN